MCYSIREAGEGEAEKIYSLMKTVYEGIEDKSTFICDGLDVVKKHLSPPHFGLVAEGADGHLAASVFTRVPGEDEDNLGREIPLFGAELDKVIH
nr:hypothetical protein [Lachnospiraceae bacterium]